MGIFSSTEAAVLELLAIRDYFLPQCRWYRSGVGKMNPLTPIIFLVSNDRLDACTYCQQENCAVRAWPYSRSAEQPDHE